MKKTDTQQSAITINKIEEKYRALGENPLTYLQGLLHAKPLNYWDYIEVDTLLSLQKPRTLFKDETVFILYHQLTELVLKMMRHELEQIVDEEIITEAFLKVKINRLIRYTNMLITSFDIMRDGMDHTDYNIFRATLTPASGFQSAQFRYIELYCTQLQNLINDAGKKRISSKPTIDEYFEYIYWKDAGVNRKTGEKSLTLSEFEARYLDSFKTLAKKLLGKTLEDKILTLAKPTTELKELLREFDYLYNVVWPKVHLKTAQHYLESEQGTKEATGGSKWKKYLHPKHQQRKFFPTLWTKSEKENWGNNKTLPS